MPFLQIFSGLSFKSGRGQQLLFFYRTLLWLAEFLVKSDRCRREEENHSEYWRCCAFPGRYLAVFCEAVLRGECLVEREATSLLGRKTSSGENLL